MLGLGGLQPARERKAGELAVLTGVAYLRFVIAGQRLLQGLQCNLRLEIPTGPLPRRGQPALWPIFPDHLIQRPTKSGVSPAYGPSAKRNTAQFSAFIAS